MGKIIEHVLFGIAVIVALELVKRIGLPFWQQVLILVPIFAVAGAATEVIGTKLRSRRAAKQRGGKSV